ncbi:hypothetical protein D9757_005398 [Collybiopsis confluens]|uniref:TPPC8 C-terminal Ig-like domain-containing protein n=1 Tax=Collybiopsis confluens TaxID=2823264 RepID=A0A8H5HLA7_9AGAR|nr:hypothetical protein D9757_005398 [Collybiopsis confluens]
MLYPLKCIWQTRNLETGIVRLFTWTRASALLAMAPPLPSSLSPHICILSSPDLQDLLAAASLPQLPEILQSFSPLPQVTTRTTSLASVSHKAFSLRISDLNEIELACREDEEQRAVRMVDWIGSRIGARCAQWVEDMEKQEGKQPERLPWWEDLKRCLEGDHTPSKTETWNHPAAIILAVSTNTPNPLQAVSNLHSRTIDLPSWVDPTWLRYTLIVHPKGSALSDEEAGALYNAVKKQYGLHSYLLPLDMPNPPPAPVPVPTSKPRLPSAGSDYLDVTNQSSSRTGSQSTINTLRMNEKDIQQTAKFTREFLVMSLIPWMEKCVLDWNENFISTRRLPSRLFSSTRRLFGTPSPSPSPAPTHRSSSSRSSTLNVSSAPAPFPLVGGPPPQQRRLAEFATILGDFKLAVTVWETLSKEGRGGSDILPLLLSPSLSLSQHVSNALNGAITQPTALSQLRALLSAVRWEIGIDPMDFGSEMLAGERWLVWAAGSAEEPPAALLLAQAAFMSSKKLALRRAALWYLSAAKRLEKCGIKPLTMYFLRRAHDLYQSRPRKELSPSFWDADATLSPGSQNFDSIMSGIEHPLARLLYTTGDIKDAVKIFLGLLKGSASPTAIQASLNDTETDGVYLEDFRVAFEHLKSTLTDGEQMNELTLPFNLCNPRQTKLRFSDDDSAGQRSEWKKQEETWVRFAKSHEMSHHIATESRAYTNEPFWIDLALTNPLDVDVTLTNITVKAQEPDGSSSKSCLTIGVVDSVTVGAKETRTIPISVISTRPTTLTITHATYNFLSLLPSAEALAVRGKRLYNTPAQRQTPTYAADILMKVDVMEPGCRLLVNLAEDKNLTLCQGEVTALRLWMSNVGATPINEVWLIVGSESLWLGEAEQEEGVFTDEYSSGGTLHSTNSLRSQEPFAVPLGSLSTLAPEASLEVPLRFYVLDAGQKEIHISLLYREHKEALWKQARKAQACEVRPLFRVASSAIPSSNIEDMFLLDLTLQNISNYHIQITQISAVSPTWRSSSSVNAELGPVYPLQSSQFTFGVNPWDDASGCIETLKYISTKLADVIHGKEMQLSDPPQIDLCYSHIVQPSPSNTCNLQKLVHSGKRHVAASSILSTFNHIPNHLHPHIFPLFNPAALDFLICWKIPAENRSGALLVSGLNLGASHSPLRDILDAAGTLKSTRSMYAETRRERKEVLQSIRTSEWNSEMNPVHVVVNSTSQLAHDFTKGPCRARIDLTVRNYSTTSRAKVMLSLNSKAPERLPSDVHPIVYSGKLTYRATLEPIQCITFAVVAWIDRPGTYSLESWWTETEVLERIGDNTECVRYRYLEERSRYDDNSLITVCQKIDSA